MKAEFSLFFLLRHTKGSGPLKCLCFFMDQKTCLRWARQFNRAFSNLSPHWRSFGFPEPREQEVNTILLSLHFYFCYPEEYCTFRPLAAHINKREWSKEACRSQRPRSDIQGPCGMTLDPLEYWWGAETVWNGCVTVLLLKKILMHHHKFLSAIKRPATAHSS